MSFRLLTLALIFFGLGSCDGEESKISFVDSFGRINNLLIVADKSTWSKAAGDTIRDIFAAPVDGLPREEPLFNMTQIPLRSFTGFITKSRSVLRISRSDSAQISFQKNVFASPQTLVDIKAPTLNGIIKLLKENEDSLMNVFKATELREKQRLIQKSLLDDTAIRENFGISMKIPSAYRYAKKTPDFFWLRRNIQSGDLDIIIYEQPLNAVQRDSSAIKNIIKIRDTVGSREILVDEGGAFVTEAAYAPYLLDAKIDGKYAFQSKGMWEVKNKYMAGPFINYIIRDEENNRLLVIEGFVFAPSLNQREYMFELDAILRSTQFLK